MLELVAINTEYVINDKVTTVVAMNEMIPNDPVIKTINKNHPHRVQPLVEYIDDYGNWHVSSLEDFLATAKEK